MSIITEVYLYCDGGKECPKDSAANVDGQKQDISAKQLRAKFCQDEGWVRRGRNDYCEACAKRLGYSEQN
jgi:hypothetical protein